jgi:hypothetical protein
MSGYLKVTDQLFLLGIDRDDGLPRALCVVIPN